MFRHIGDQLTVNPVLSISSISGQTVCAGGQVQPITFSGTPGASYNWTNNGVLIGLAARKMDNGNEATEGTYYYVLEALGYDGKTYSYKGPITLVK